MIFSPAGIGVGRILVAATCGILGTAGNVAEVEAQPVHPSLQLSLQLRVLVSPGFAVALDSLAAEFERREGITLAIEGGPSTGGAGSIPGRLARGEPADVVVLADEGMAELLTAGSVRPDSRVTLARTGVGLAVPAGADRPDVSTLASLRQALLAASSIAFSTGPSGTHVGEVVLPALGIAAEVTAKAVRTNDVPGALARGDAVIGFQQVSELVPAPGIDFIGPLPAEIQLHTTYSAAVAGPSEQVDRARAFIAFLAAPENAPLLHRLGLEPAH